MSAFPEPQEIERVKLPLESSWTLPPSAYTSEEVFNLEKTAFFGDVWQSVARVDQIPEKGDYLSLDLMDQPLLIVHGHDGEIRVMSRVCLHRAAPIVDGCGNRFVFTCPYHAWSYDTAGNLKRAPMMEDAEGFEEHGQRLPQAAVEIWNGFILANFAATPTPLAPQLQTFTDYFKAFRIQDMEVVKTIEYDSGWNWKVLVENFMEAYHHIGTHNTSLEPIYNARDSAIPDNDGPWSILHMSAVEHNEESPVPPIEGLEEWQRNALFANVVFPMFTFAVNSTSMFWYQILPLAADHLLLKIHICMPRAYRELPGYDQIVEGTAALADAVHQEDILANNLVWQGLNGPLTRQGRLSPFERSIWQLNQWWLQTVPLFRTAI